MGGRKIVPWLPARERLPRAGLHFSAGTYLFLLATALIGFIGLDTDANLLLILFGLCVGALIVSALAAWTSLRGLTVTRTVVDSVPAGQPFEVRYQFRNPQRWLRARSVHLVDLPESTAGMPVVEALIGAIAPGETLTVTARARCPRRGRVSFDRVAIATRFPFGLFTRYETFAIPQTMVIYPPLGAIRERRWQTRHHAERAVEGLARSRAGDGEFFGVREYRAGDSPRRIHWRRSARAGTLVVRELAEPATQRVWVVLDTRVAAGDAYAADRLETAISAAATVACDAIEQNHKVGLICNGEPWLLMPPGGGRDYRLRILHELAVRDANPSDRLLDRLRRIKYPTHWRGLCLLFTGRANDDLPEAVRLMASRLGPVSIFAPGTPAFDAVYSPPRAHAAPEPAVAAGGRRW